MPSRFEIGPRIKRVIMGLGIAGTAFSIGNSINDNLRASDFYRSAEFDHTMAIDSFKKASDLYIQAHQEYISGEYVTGVTDLTEGIMYYDRGIDEVKVADDYAGWARETSDLAFKELLFGAALGIPSAVALTAYVLRTQK